MTEPTGAWSGDAAHRQFYRFAIVGCLNVAVSFAVFVLCYEIWPVGSLVLDRAGGAGAWLRNALAEQGILAVDAAVANAVGYAAGMLNSFLLNRAWTFRARGRLLRQLHRFVVLNMLGLLLSSLLLFIFVDVLAGPFLLVWAVATAIVMLLNFCGNKFWTFAQSHRREASSWRPAD